MNAMDSIFLPRFTIGENAFDAFHDEMGRYGKKVAVIHGERAWKAARRYFHLQDTMYGQNRKGMMPIP